MKKRNTAQLCLAAASMIVLACTAKTDAPIDSAAANAPAAIPETSNGPTMPPGTSDAQMQAVLDELAALGGKPIETLTPAEARRQPTPTDAVKRVLTKQGKPTTPDPTVSSADRTIPGPAGPLPVRIYTPKTGSGPFPIVVYYHGGGWVIADKNVYDGGARGIAKNANAVVVSVDYRQGPENKFPAAHDDAYATYEWAMKNAASIKGDPNRMAVAGESAGGNLAVATAMAARDKGQRMPKAIIAVYPVASGDTISPSYVENANAKPLNRAMVTWFVKHYFTTPEEAKDPRISLVAANLAGLPPTTIINAQIDPLRSDGEELADKLRAAGVTVQQKTYEGVNHEFFGMAAAVDKARDAQMMAGNALKSVFGQSNTAPASAAPAAMPPAGTDTTAMRR